MKNWKCDWWDFVVHTLFFFVCLLHILLLADSWIIFQIFFAAKVQAEIFPINIVFFYCWCAVPWIFPKCEPKMKMKTKSENRRRRRRKCTSKSQTVFLSVNLCLRFFLSGIFVFFFLLKNADMKNWVISVFYIAFLSPHRYDALMDICCAFYAIGLHARWNGFVFLLLHLLSNFSFLLRAFSLIEHTKHKAMWKLCLEQPSEQQ